MRVRGNTHDPAFFLQIKIKLSVVICTKYSRIPSVLDLSDVIILLSQLFDHKENDNTISVQSKWVPLCHILPTLQETDLPIPVPQEDQWAVMMKINK